MSGLPFAAWDGFLIESRETEVSAQTDAQKAERLLSTLFERQRRVIDSKARRIVLKPGRRGGKTRGIGAYLLRTACLHPGNEMSVYITLTKHHSQRNLERVLDELIAKFDLAFTKANVTGQLQYKHDNGHVIWLTGCKDKNEADKIRGDKYRLAVVDEAGSGLFNRVVKGDVEGSKAVTLLQYLCQSVLGPALSDLGGKLLVSGTPWVLPVGFFFEISTGEGKRAQWETHEWTVLDNPFHRYSPECPTHDDQATADFRDEARDDWGCELYTEAEQEELRKQGVVPLYPGMPWLKKATASFEREYFSRWIRDSEALCYSYVASRNSFFAAEEQGLISRSPTGEWVFPQGDWTHVLTIDIGHNDDTTFTVASSRRGFPHVFYRKSFGKPGMLTSQRAAEAMRLRHQFGIKGEVVVDEGALGKAIAEDMRSAYGVPCRPAQKSAKASAIRNLSDAQRRGVVFIDTLECEQLVAEWMTVTWNADRTDHDEDCMDDCSDGSLYNYREHPTHEEWKPEPPRAGTPEAANAEMAAYKARLAKQQAIVHSGMRQGEKRRALRALRR